jgi:hypothetical protein
MGSIWFEYSFVFAKTFEYENRLIVMRICLGVFELAVVPFKKLILKYCTHYWLKHFFRMVFFWQSLLYTRQMESSGNYEDIFEKLWVCGVDLWRVYKDMNIIIKLLIPEYSPI